VCSDSLVAPLLIGVAGVARLTSALSAGVSFLAAQAVKASSPVGSMWWTAFMR
jgi:hypothetical protein